MVPLSPRDPEGEGGEPLSSKGVGGTDSTLSPREVGKGGGPLEVVEGVHFSTSTI